MKKPLRLLAWLLALVLLAALGAWLVLGLGTARQREKIAALESLEARLTAERVPLRFMVLSRASDEISARVKLYDLDGRELAAFERSFRGGELFFDFVVAPLGEDWLAFPRRVFTELTPAQAGVSLLGYYEREGFPGVFGSETMGKAEREAVKELYREALRAAGGSEPGSEGGTGGASGEGAAAGRRAGGSEAARLAGRSFGSAVHEVSTLSRFDVGVVYKIVCRSKGGIEIMED